MGFYAVPSRDELGRPLRLEFRQTDGQDDLLMDLNFSWEGNLPSGELHSPVGFANSPAWTVQRSYRGDSLVESDSSWTRWDSVARVLLVRSSQDTLCPYRDSIVLDPASRPVLRHQCREGVSWTVDGSGTRNPLPYRSWERIRFEYRASEDTLPWREENWVRERDASDWTLQDSGSTQGDPDRPRSLRGKFHFSPQTFSLQRMEYEWNSTGHLESSDYFVDDSVQTRMEYGYDAQGRLVREITTESVSDTVTWSYAQAVLQAIGQRRASGLTVVRAQDGLNVLGEDVLESRLLDVQGKVLWSQGRGNHLALPEGRGLTILQVVTRSGRHSWTLPFQP